MMQCNQSYSCSDTSSCIKPPDPGLWTFPSINPPKSVTSGCWWLVLGPPYIPALGNQAWNISFRFQLLCLGMREVCSGSLNLQDLGAVPVVTPQTIFHMKPKRWNSLAWGTCERAGAVPEPTPARLLVFQLLTKRWFVQKKSEVKHMSSGRLEMEIVLMWGTTHTWTGGCFGVSPETRHLSHR